MQRQAVRWLSRQRASAHTLTSEAEARRSAVQDLVGKAKRMCACAQACPALRTSPLSHTASAWDLCFRWWHDEQRIARRMSVPGCGHALLCANRPSCVVRHCTPCALRSFRSARCVASRHLHACTYMESHDRMHALRHVIFHQVGWWASLCSPDSMHANGLSMHQKYSRLRHGAVKSHPTPETAILQLGQRLGACSAQ